LWVDVLDKIGSKIFFLSLISSLVVGFLEKEVYVLVYLCVCSLSIYWSLAIFLFLKLGRHASWASLKRDFSNNCEEPLVWSVACPLLAYLSYFSGQNISVLVQ
jgi:hypothetical protein